MGSPDASGLDPTRGTSPGRRSGRSRDSVGRGHGSRHCPAGPRRPRLDTAARHRWLAREVGGLGHLPVRGSCGRAEVAERVPGLLDDEDSVAGVAHADIDRVGWVGRARREFEGGRPTRPPGQRKQMFLHREVAGVGQLSHHAEWPGRMTRPGVGRAQTPIRTHVSSRYPAGRSPSSMRLIQAGGGRALAPRSVLREPRTHATRFHRSPECDRDGLRQARGLPDGDGLPGSGR